MPWGAEEGLRAQQLSGCFKKRPDLGQRMAVQCGWASYTLRPESLVQNRWRIGPGNLEPRLLVFADNYGLSTFCVPRTQQ